MHDVWRLEKKHVPWCMMGTVMVWTNKRKKGGNLHCERCYLKLTAEAIIFHSHADEAERGEMY